MISILLCQENYLSTRGRDVVDHPPRLHDDFANAAALVLVEADVKTRSGIPADLTAFVRTILHRAQLLRS